MKKASEQLLLVTVDYFQKAVLEREESSNLDGSLDT